MDKKHRRKMTAPIVVTVLMAAYYLLYFGFLAHVIGGILGMLLGVIPLVLTGVMVYVCVQRIKEIRSGEEDDLSQY